MAINITYWQEADGMWLGYMNDYPDYWTQGHTLDELKSMLISLRKDMVSEPMPGLRHQGVLEFA